MSFTVSKMYAASVSPIKHHKLDRTGRPIPHWKSKAKWRKDGTLKKVVTKAKRGSGNPEARSWIQGIFGKNNYKSKIKFDKTGRIKSAKNNRTKNRHKKDPRRLSRAKWIARDMTPYHDESSIIRVTGEREKMFNKGRVKKPKTQWELVLERNNAKRGKSNLGPAFKR